MVLKLDLYTNIRKVIVTILIIALCLPVAADMLSDSIVNESEFTTEQTQTNNDPQTTQEIISVSNESNVQVENNSTDESIQMLPESNDTTNSTNSTNNSIAVSEATPIGNSSTNILPIVPESIPISNSSSNNLPVIPETIPTTNNNSVNNNLPIVPESTPVSNGSNNNLPVVPETPSLSKDGIQNPVVNTNLLPEDTSDLRITLYSKLPQIVQTSLITESLNNKNVILFYPGSNPSIEIDFSNLAPFTKVLKLDLEDKNGFIIYNLPLRFINSNKYFF